MNCKQFLTLKGRFALFLGIIAIIIGGMETYASDNQMAIGENAAGINFNADTQNHWSGYGYDAGSAFTAPDNLTFPLAKIWEYEFRPEMPEIKQYWIHNVIAAKNTILVPAAAWHKGRHDWMDWNYGAGTPSITGLNAQTGQRIWSHAPAQTDAGYGTWWLAADPPNDRFWQNDDGETGHYTGIQSGTACQPINWPNLIFSTEQYTSVGDIWGAIKIIGDDGKQTILSSMCIGSDCPGIGISMRADANRGISEKWYYTALAKQCPLGANCEITGNIADLNASLAVNLPHQIVLYTPNILNPAGEPVPNDIQGKSGLYAFNVTQPNVNPSNLRGQYKWFIPGNFISAVSTAGNEVFAVSQDNDNQRRLKNFNINNGDILWQSQSLPSLVSFQAPAIHNNKVYIIANDHLYAFDITIGEMLWQSQQIPNSAALGGPETHGNGIGGYFMGALETTLAISAPANTVYVTGDKKVYAIDAENGQIKWQSEDLTVNSTLRNPIIAYGNLYIVEQPWGDSGQSGDPALGTGGKVIALQGQIVPPAVIFASPNPCFIHQGQITCSSTIAWNVADAPSACVFIKETKQPFACGASGSQDISEITERGLTFEVHSTNDINSPLLASVFVKGDKQSTCSGGPVRACIDFVCPNPVKRGEIITFKGRGETNNPDQIIKRYKWRLDSTKNSTKGQGRIGRQKTPTCQINSSFMSVGTHIIYFRVKVDERGRHSWSPWASRQFVVVE